MSCLTVDAGKADVKTSPEEVGVVGQAQVDLRIDREIRRQCNLHFAGRDAHRAFEARRPAGGEKLLRIGPDTGRAGNGELDVQAAIGTAGCPVLPTADGVSLSCVQKFFVGRWCRRACLFSHGLPSWGICGGFVAADLSRYEARSGRKEVRISGQNNSGCSQAAK